MPIVENQALRKLRAGNLAVGFGLHHLRTAASPALAAAAGFDWLFIDTEHGAFSVQEATQLCLAALPTGITPIVRICADAIDEGTRALDNGAMGIVVPHVNTPKQARRIAEAFRYPPLGHRSWGGPPAIFGFRAPPPAEAQDAINGEILVCAMIETPEAVASAREIAEVPGIDALMIGTSDLSAEMGIAGQIGHEKVQKAYADVAAACRKEKKVLGMGGVYDEKWAAHYVGVGARFLLGGGDHGFIVGAGAARVQFLRGLPLAGAKRRKKGEAA
ncbi:MAG: aldolase/citrate lyase family protein [Rhodospirillales bacterium]|nr:aldolase/citrate lyase family protein [Rhodospirillales bacterium]